ncbi:hypothetical protein BAE44_0008958 [Dichanthelium oligosanthes]|uniref:Remorin C-terminal domain-containing protein n=1 Tax=Dichanthelium oligosanthes TaxID=888268 RepID=A0A1E5VY30_9POAL|nr:hypothetical protein BAE44_0008958 [Dichanthelium oligosanthes]
MRPLDDKECYSYTTNGAANGRPHRKNPASSRSKPMPSKWEDAQKWLVGMSSGRADGIHGSTVKPRNSNADDRRLLSSSSQNGRVSCSSLDGALEYSMVVTVSPTPTQLGESDDVGETKKIDRMVQQHGSPVAVIRSVCLRDMGTEMTPIASKEPSRTATPLRASTPVACSPISSRSSTPARRRQEGPVGVTTAVVLTTEPVAAGKMKADQMKARAQEKLANRLAATRRIAEEKRASAEAKLNERAARTSEKANYIRRTGHLPSTFKMPCLCG